MARMCAAALVGLLISCATASAQTTYFTRYIAFGDSLSDNGRVLRETGINLPGKLDAALGSTIYEGGRMSNAFNYYELVPQRIGIHYNPADDFSVGGASAVHQNPDAANSPAFAYGLPDQIDQAAARLGRFAPRDLINIWIGYNGIAAVASGTAEQKAAAATALVTNTTGAIGRLAGLGAREFVIFNQKTDRPDMVSLGPLGTYPIGGNDVSTAINRQLPSALAPLSAAGLNIHYFDVDALIKRLRAHPTAFGYGPDANTPCTSVPSCLSAGSANNGAIENQYITVDGAHSTGRTNAYIAAFLSNQLNAPLSIGPQADIGATAGRTFSSDLFEHLDSDRRRNQSTGFDPRDVKPRNTKAPAGIDAYADGPISAFAVASYSTLNRNTQTGPDGVIGNNFRADFFGVTAGLQYQVTPTFLVGVAFNYLNTSTGLSDASAAKIDLRSFQGGSFASFKGAHFFADIAATYGVNNYRIDRPGALNDHLTASPNGNTLTIAGRAGYLFDIGSMRIGPVSEVTYTNVRVGAYEENGDPLLTIGARGQTLDGVTAGAGLQMRASQALFGANVSPFLNLLAQHDFLDGLRTVSSYQTYAPDLLIRTQTGHIGDDVYGRLSGGIDVALGHGVSGAITGSATFARSAGDYHVVRGSLRYQF